MEILSLFSHYGLWFLALITALVFVHELGHFVVARWCGVKVEVFSIGFGRELFGYTDKKGTRWRFSLLPLGGYVRMFGSPDLGLEGEAGKPLGAEQERQSFLHQSPAKRIAISAAGPLANYLFALVVLAILYAIVGKTYSSPVVGEVLPNSAALEAGIVAGDKILSIDGAKIDRFEDIGTIVRLNLDKPLSFEIERDKQVLNLVVTPRIVEEKDPFGNVQRVGRIDVRSAGPGETVILSPLESVQEAGREVIQMSGNILTGIWQIITGTRSSDELGGILRIAKISGDVATLGFGSVIALSVLLSVNLGLLNLFPVPMLDGGQIVYYTIEWIRGKPVGEQAQEWGLRIGLAALLGLMLFATWNDLVYLRVFDYLGSLFT